MLLGMVSDDTVEIVAIPWDKLGDLQSFLRRPAIAANWRISSNMNSRAPAGLERYTEPFPGKGPCCPGGTQCEYQPIE